MEWKRYSLVQLILYDQKKHAGWHNNILLTTDYECSIQADFRFLVASLAGSGAQAVCEIQGGGKAAVEGGGNTSDGDKLLSLSSEDQGGPNEVPAKGLD